MKVKASAPSPEAPSMAKAIDIYLAKMERGEQIDDVEVKNDEAKEEFIRTQQNKLQKKNRSRAAAEKK
jgi:uroporphyrinogen-III synthase